MSETVFIENVKQYQKLNMPKKVKGISVHLTLPRKNEVLKEHSIKFERHVHCVK